MNESIVKMMRKRPRALPMAALVLAVVGLFAGAQTAPADTLGGPVIIGGDDLTDHGGLDENGKPALGWLYIQRALENIAPKVTRQHDGSVAALGSGPSDSTQSDAGAAIGSAAAEAAVQPGLTVSYHEGAEAITAFLSALDAGEARPRIIWIAGDGASNDLDSEEAEALSADATTLADFVNTGGGLMSHGSEYEWLFALLPGLEAVCCGSEDDLELTPEGTAAFPGLTNNDVNAGFEGQGPWHNHFEGNTGGLQVLVKSTSIDDSSGNDAAVIIGGAAVQLPGAITLEPGSATNPVGGSHTVTATVRGSDGSLLTEVEVTFSITSGPNAGKSDTGTTGGNGQTSFTYTDDGGAGTDTIEASFIDDTQTRRSTSATKTWGVEEPLPPPAPPPALPPPGPTPADLTITIKQEELPPAASSAQGFAVAAGTRMRYTVTVTNNGPGVARNAALSLGAPAGSSFDSLSTDTGSCSGSATVSCSFGTLSVGQQAHVTSTATLGQAGPATATGSVSASEPDPSSSNNSASATVDVSAVPPQADPVFGDQAVPVVVSGFVCVQLPSSNECVDISTLTDIPVGSIIDTTKGRVRLTVATSTGTLEAVELYEGVFQLLQTTLAARSTQARAQAASVTELRLVGGDFSKCTAQPAKVKAKAKAKKTKKRKPAAVDQAKPRQPVRRLWGEGSGSFRTRGRYSSATVRGTVWLTEDYCNGTLIRVREGTVTVRDLVKNRTVIVTAGKSYFAEAPAPKAAKAKAKAKAKSKKRKPAKG